MTQRIIKGRTLIPDEWRVVEKDSALIPAGERIILPLALWSTTKSREQYGVWLDSEQTADDLTATHSADLLNDIALIAINFPTHTDGRGFSTARLLRERHGYKGELRAIGAFLRDQLYYLERCGFDAFALTDKGTLEDALRYFSIFPTHYQNTADQPLFKRQGY